MAAGVANGNCHRDWEGNHRRATLVCMPPIIGLSIVRPFVGIANACPHTIGSFGHILNSQHVMLNIKRTFQVRTICDRFEHKLVKIIATKEIAALVALLSANA